MLDQNAATQHHATMTYDLENGDQLCAITVNHAMLNDKKENVMFEVKAASNDTVGVLKARIETIEGISRHHQRLIYAGKILSDDLSLSDQNIASGSIIHLLLRHLCDTEHDDGMQMYASVLSDLPPPLAASTAAKLPTRFLSFEDPTNLFFVRLYWGVSRRDDKLGFCFFENFAEGRFETVALHYEAGMTIRQVKAKFHENEGVPSDFVRLVYCSEGAGIQTLHDDRTLAEYSIPSDAILFAVPSIGDMVFVKAFTGDIIPLPTSTHRFCRSEVDVWGKRIRRITRNRHGPLHLTCTRGETGTKPHLLPNDAVLFLTCEQSAAEEPGLTGDECGESQRLCFEM